jgi:uncharacterized protein YbjT (DUF2867 family)
MRVAVAGGTGLVGRMAVAKLRAAGHEPVVLARSQGVDLTTGAGVVDKLFGSETVIDVTNVVTTRKKVAADFFSQAAGNLVAGSLRAGVEHVISLSIVGSDRVDFTYYFGKREQEETIRSSSVPWTILRATQFFEFPEPLLAGRSPLVPMPAMLSQPIAASEVAQALVSYVDRKPSGMAPELAGPEQLRMVDMARSIARARGMHKFVLPVSLPGSVGKAMSSGGLLPQGEHDTGKQTFEQYLAGVRASAGSR